MNISDKYILIINTLISYYGIDKADFINLLRKKENKYLLLLFFKKYRCIDMPRTKELFKYKAKRSVLINIQKAEEKFLINRDFRERYFELEEELIAKLNNNII